jgi:hypothetical protein
MLLDCLVSKGIFLACDIWPRVLGSDHCPVTADLSLTSLVPPGKEREPPVCLFVCCTCVVREFQEAAFSLCLCCAFAQSLCARFFPELSGRQQNIRSFFSAAAPSAPASFFSSSSSTSASSSTALAPSASASAAASQSSNSASGSGSSGAPFPSLLKRKSSESKAGANKKAKKSSSTAGSSSLLGYFGAARPKPTAAGAVVAKTPLLASAAANTQTTAPAPAVLCSTPTASGGAAAIVGSAPNAAPPSAASLAPAPTPAAPTQGADCTTPTGSAARAWSALLDQKETKVLCSGHRSCAYSSRFLWLLLSRGIDISLPLLHREACLLLSVTKKGPNHGRQFYICRHPVPKRCNYFLWYSERFSKAPASKATKPKAAAK